MKKEELISDIERLEKRLEMAKKSGMLPEIAEKKQLEKINSLKDELKKIEDEETAASKETEKKTEPKKQKPKGRGLKEAIDENKTGENPVSKIANSKNKINFGELGSKVELPGGHIVSKTSDTQAILFFKGDQKETVAFTYENGSWIIDCCEKRGDKYPEYSKSELDDAVWYIIDELECKEQTESRIEAIRKRKKYVQKQNELSEPEKVVNTVEKAAESVENRVEEIVENGDSFPPSKAEEVGEEFVGIIETVKGAIKKQTDAKAFIKKLIQELQKLLSPTSNKGV